MNFGVSIPKEPAPRHRVSHSIVERPEIPTTVSASRFRTRSGTPLRETAFGADCARSIVCMNMSFSPDTIWSLLRGCARPERIIIGSSATFCAAQIDSGCASRRWSPGESYPACTHSVLPQMHFSAVSAKLPFCSDVFPVCAGGDREIRRVEGREACRKASAQVPSVPHG